MTQDILSELLDAPSWAVRAKAIERIAMRYTGKRLGEDDRHAVEDAFRIVLYDGEVLVRRVLSESLKDCSELPRDILMGLALDIAEVAQPILEHSPLLQEDDLLTILRDRSPDHAQALAQRVQLPLRVADELRLRGLLVPRQQFDLQEAASEH